MSLDESVRASLNMNFLCAFASSIGRTSVSLPSGKVLSIASLTVRFPLAVPARLAPGILKKTYTVKPLVDMGGGGVFGELAIVACLAKDGWGALWADTFHGQKFWRDMPHLSIAVTPPSSVRKLYDRIANGKGGAAGCFDVVA